MMNFINDVIISFRSCFSRNATFEWFITVVIGLMVRTDNLGVTSIIRALYLKAEYMGLIGFFRSKGWNLKELTSKWCEIIRDKAPLVTLKGAVIMVGDAVKGSKEGRKMPGVKRHHQESDNSSKPEYIYGHMFGSVGILAEKEDKQFCIPLSMTLQDGVKTIIGWDEPTERQDSHVVETIRNAANASEHFGSAILLLDRQYLSVSALKTLDEAVAKGCQLHIVTKAKSNCTAFQEPEPNKRGRPRIKGESVKLFSLFDSEKDHFKMTEILLYGKPVKAKFHCVDLLWGENFTKNSALSSLNMKESVRS